MRVKAALVQMNSGPQTEKNLKNLLPVFADLKRSQSRLIVLPEVFATYCRDSLKVEKAETLDSSTVLDFLQSMARDCQAYICGGSLLLKSANGKVSNTCPVFNPKGELIALYSKMHLFDANPGDGRSYRESRTVSPGHHRARAGLPWGQLGLSICYDLRFPEFFRGYPLKDLFAFCLPSAFTYKTGSQHWEILLRARAIENQCYFLAPNQCGVSGHGLHCYGHSMIVGPKGEILACLEEDEGFVIADLDLSHLQSVRRQMPVLNHQKLD